jgi:cation-transporting ATPase E
VLVLIAGSPKDALFAGVIVSNSVIGIVQELRARRTLNELAVLSAPKARVLRDGVVFEIGVSQVVADDVLVLEPGDQVVVDGQVLDGVGLELDESLLTGESEPVDKAAGDEVLSGSFVSAGSGHYVATRIGREAFASSLSEEARRFELAHSELKRGINVILRWLTVIIPPAAILLLIRLLGEEDRWQDALIGTVAASVAMVPDGLVLLTSLAFIVGVVALARRQALAKELASVELLARVDTLCLDKTGTITTGDISLGGIEVLGDHGEAFVRSALGAVGAADPKPNATLAAIVAAYPSEDGWVATDVVPFSSARKWAAAAFDGQGAFYLGAPDILLAADDVDTRARVAAHADAGRRVLLLARVDGGLAGDTLAAGRVPVALVLLEDTIKPDAPEILAYFRDQGVDLKVISGDHPSTVAAVARRAGVPGADHGFDARELPEDLDELGELLETTAVFGRVTPHQKRAMVAAMQRRGRVVAMTGDGVNDVLALKDSDMGIAMGSGSSATRAVAQLVLLDNRFSTLPRVLAEGRKVINNIERVANLFITKASYAVLLTALVAIAGMPYPFLPRQLTLIGTFTIGVPGFFLALAPNTRLVKAGFLDRVLRFSVPAGAAAGIATFVAYVIVRNGDDIVLSEARTVATMTLLTIGLVVLVMISVPLEPWKIALAAAMAGGYVLAMVIPAAREYFELDLPPDWAWGVYAACAAVGSLVVVALPRIVPAGPNGHDER